MEAPTAHAEDQRRRRSDGERTRRAILERAAELATIEGLDGLSIAGLAGQIGMSKSGLYAHFGSKEELQLATIETAQHLFTDEVTRPGLERTEGLDRLLGVCDAFLSHLEREVFPGGCFFAAAAAEFDTHDGRVKDRILDFYRDWMGLLSGLISESIRRDQVDSSTDVDQLAFEIDSLLLGANAAFVLFSDRSALERARVAIRARVEQRA
jgi:AcrR family transcriptional regulator